jgi:uncharacterized protein (TIGR03083 family)
MADAHVQAHVEALRASVARLRGLASGMSETELTGRAYPTQWSVADVLSHLGSGAVITRRRLDDALADQATPDEFAPAVWDEWNAKTPAAQRDDALHADADLLAGIDAASPQQRDSFTSAMGPMTLDFTEFVAMRLNEHVFHTWDIEVVGDEAAVLPPDAAALVVDNLDLIARFTARPTGDTTTLTAATTDPARGFRIDLTPDTVTITSVPDPATADITLPAEAFCRLVYGRLDPDHTPATADGPALDVLRPVFPGP